jgi:hypothetical protein
MMDLRTRLFIGCLGALSPILANLLVLDLNLMLVNATPITVASYVVRQLALCIAACIIVYLSPDATKPMTIFQLGIAAPALLIGIINGISQTKNLTPHAELQIPAIVGSAFAQPAPPSGGSVPTNLQAQVSDCLKRESTTSQQILKGAFGILPDDRWFVVVSSNLQLQTAIADVQDIQRKYPGKYRPKICAPVDGDNHYRVAIAENLTYDAATKLRDEAVGAGLPKGTWLWSPLQSGSSR